MMGWRKKEKYEREMMGLKKEIRKYLLILLDDMGKVLPEEKKCEHCNVCKERMTTLKTLIRGKFSPFLEGE